MSSYSSSVCFFLFPSKFFLMYIHIFFFSHHSLSLYIYLPCSFTPSLSLSLSLSLPFLPIPFYQFHTSLTLSASKAYAPVKRNGAIVPHDSEDFNVIPRIAPLDSLNNLVSLESRIPKKLMSASIGNGAR